MALVKRSITALLIIMAMVMQAAALQPVWNVDLGSILASGLYTAPPTGGTATVTATNGQYVAKATVTVQPGQHSVTLTWQASTSTNVVSYNVYRALVSGGPYAKIGNVTVLTFTDTAVTSGTTYFYVVTAVDSTNTESGYSNQAQAPIP